MPQCHMYFIGTAASPAITKIGISLDPRKRLAGLKTASPFPLFLFASVGFKDRTQAEWSERVMHAALEDYRMRGEWFSVSPSSAFEVSKAVSDLISSKDFHPDDFIGLCQMIAFQCLDCYNE